MNPSKQKKIQLLKEELVQLEQEVLIQSELPQFFVLDQEALLAGLSCEINNNPNPFEALKICLNTLSTNPSAYVKYKVSVSIVSDPETTLFVENENKEEFVSQSDKENKKLLQEVTPHEESLKSFYVKANEDIAKLIQSAYYNNKLVQFEKAPRQEEKVSGSVEGIKENETATVQVWESFDITSKTGDVIPIDFVYNENYIGERADVATDRGTKTWVEAELKSTNLEEVYYEATDVSQNLTEENKASLTKIFNKKY